MFAQSLLATISQCLGTRFGLSSISSDSTFGVIWINNSCLTHPRLPEKKLRPSQITQLQQGSHHKPSPRSDFAGSPSTSRGEMMTGSHTFILFPFPAACKALSCLFFPNTTSQLSCWECCWCGHLHRTAGMERSWLAGDFPCYLTTFPLFPWLFIAILLQQERERASAVLS